jgi:hypothetical protein
MFTLTDIAEIVTLISLCMGAVWALGAAGIIEVTEYYQ